MIADRTMGQALAWCAVMLLPWTAAGAEFKNPLKVQGADPWMTYYQGSYYLTATAGRGIVMRSARHIGELRNAEDRVVWMDREPARSKGVWAPECHLLKDPFGRARWYLYYTATDDKDEHHRCYVLEGNGPTPLGPYTFKGQWQTDPKNEFYAIDPTVLTTPEGRTYALWCGRPSPAGQGLYISRMANPWTLTGPRTYLPADGFGCSVVREGPEMIVKNGKVFLIYSACGASTPDYKLGMLSAKAGADLLKPESWAQTPRAVFAANPQAGVWGPGHGFFFRSPDGKEDWMVYHAKTTNRDTYADRTARAQPFTWNADGTPDFGAPVPTDVPLRGPSGE